MQTSITIEKNSVLPEHVNYDALRERAVLLIEKLAHTNWTDYNIHDPGITIIELLCYALTDLGYRTDRNIADILAEANGEIAQPDLQAFFTARNILTINPLTIIDYRKLLVDVDGIRNAWLHAKQCACNNLLLYANCADSLLQYEATEHPVVVKGFYDVWVAFETVEGAGDLNSGKIFYNFSFTGGGLGFFFATIEMRLPPWHAIDQDIKYKAFRKQGTAIKQVSVQFISGNKADNVDIASADNEAVKRQFDNALRGVLFATFNVEFFSDETLSSTDNLLFEDIPFRIWFERNESESRKALLLAEIKNAITDSGRSGILAKYLDKIHRADEVMYNTTCLLQAHRNLCEDFCSIQTVPVEDIAMCADLEVEAWVDIEAVLAEIYFQIEQYFSPDFKCYALNELVTAGKTTDEIFDGPALTNGFIDQAELEQTDLKRVLQVSDIINRIMDIKGVIAIRNVSLAKYDAAGFQVEMAGWSLPVSFNHLPRLYLEASKILVFKNNLTFLPVMDELRSTLQVIRGQYLQTNASEKNPDLLIPKGNSYDFMDYYPLQYTLPLTYGVSYEGLPASASEDRKAMAMQLRAYLLFFEQIFYNYQAQLANTKSLFSIDATIDKTYFSALLSEDLIRDYDAITEDLTADSLQQITESKATYLNRRNRFLDHLLARFAESMNDYALMLYDFFDDALLTEETLIQQKIAFLRDLPFMSRNRARAFNYKHEGPACSPDNIAGLKKRIQRILGIPDAYSWFEVYEEKDTDGVSYEKRWRLKDDNENILLSSSTRYTDSSEELAIAKARYEISQVLKHITDPNRYIISKEKKWVLNLTDKSGEVIATRKQPFSKKSDAEKAKADIILFAGENLTLEKIFIVEHILLRPRNAAGILPQNDSLLPICIPPDCAHCGEEDPYSFRLTVVMNGNGGIANKGIAYRRFAEQCIRKEIPAHLGVKICWVSTEQLELFEEAYCSWLSVLAYPEPDAIELQSRLNALLEIFTQLHNVYPLASLHDCVDGDDANRVFLNQTTLGKDEDLCKDE